MDVAWTKDFVNEELRLHIQRITERLYLILQFSVGPYLAVSQVSNSGWSLIIRTLSAPLL
jgi:hypothetical protein